MAKKINTSMNLDEDLLKWVDSRIAKKRFVQNTCSRICSAEADTLHKSVNSRTKTIITFSILVIALGSLFASDPILGNQQALAAEAEQVVVEVALEAAEVEQVVVEPISTVLHLAACCRCEGYR